jgi:DNA-binding NarL/FixJ family response regulator
VAISVVVVDDHPVVRRGIVELLSENADIAVVGEAATGEEGVRVARELGPDVVTMDLEMPGRGGIWAISQVLADAARTGRNTRVLAVTVFASDARINEAMAAGASEYIVKASPPDVFAQAVRRVAAGQAVLTAEVETALSNRKELLSRREAEILRLVAKGMSNVEIAEELYVAPSTIKTMLTRIYVKLGVTDRASAVAAALGNDLI